MNRFSKIMAAWFAAFFMLAATVVHGDAGNPVVPTATDPNFIAARKAIEAKQWKKAIELLNKVTVNADVHNFLGYSYRHLGDFEQAFHNYKRALEIDPKHLGAHEYVGEAYLLTNNPAKAQEHLAALKRICGNCEEYRDLSGAIADYRKKGAAGKVK
jgi:tetratricopeptide (TPR) repeat protein